MKWKKNETPNSEVRIEKLSRTVCNAAYDSVEELWNAFLKVGELNMVQAMEKALRHMASHGDYTGAMEVLEGIYALMEIAPSEDFTDCQRYSALSQMFIEEFLAESADFLFDEGMDGVLGLLMNESQ